MRLTDMAQVLDDAGLNVVEVSGWQNRGRRTDGGHYTEGRPTHVMVHHTAGATGAAAANEVNYMTFTSSIAPIANLYNARDGEVWVMAAGPTNTNGSGGPMPGVSANNMNRHAIGIEIGNNGVGEPYPQAQQDSVLATVAALCKAYDIPARNVYAHFEWAPGRKVDPAGPSRWSGNQNKMWDMDRFRSDVQKAMEDDMPLSEEDILRVAHAVWETPIQGPDGKNRKARWYQSRSWSIVRRWLGPSTSNESFPSPTRQGRIENNTKEILRNQDKPDAAAASNDGPDESDEDA